MSRSNITQESVDAIENTFKEIEPELRQNTKKAIEKAKQIFQQVTQIWENPKLPAQLEVRVDELHERIKNYVAAVKYLGPLKSTEEVQLRVEEEFQSRQKQAKKAMHPPDSDANAYGPRTSLKNLKQVNLFAISPSPQSVKRRTQKNQKKPAPLKTIRKQDSSNIPKALPFKIGPRFVRLGGHAARKSSLTTTTSTPSTHSKRTIDTELSVFDSEFDAFETPTNTPKQRTPLVNIHSKRKKRKSPMSAVRGNPDAKKKLDVFSLSLDSAFDPYH